MLIQKHFTRNVIEAILMPSIEDVGKVLKVGTLGIKWRKIIRQQVRKLSLRQLSSHLHSQKVTQQNSILALL